VALVFLSNFHNFLIRLFVISVLAITSVCLVIPYVSYAHANTADDEEDTDSDAKPVVAKKKAIKKAPVKKSKSKKSRKKSTRRIVQSDEEGDAKSDSSKYASLVIDADSGVILHQENAGEPRYPASLVKMMTLYMTFQALENGKLRMSQQVPVSEHASLQAPSSLFLKPGESIAVNDAIMALVIKSANDCAVVLGEAVGGNEEHFADMMNHMAKKLGMNNTLFRNATGLPNLEQKTTAFDLARLAVALRRDYPKYYGMFEKTEFTYKGKVYYTHNRVTKNYRGADGLKTGYIRASGFNLVTSARRNGKSLVGVVMGGQSIKGRDRNMMKLLDNAFYKASREDTSDAVSMDINPTPAPPSKINVNYAPDSNSRAFEVTKTNNDYSEFDSQETSKRVLTK
jgi:D-alanyl-D-alanine carboxypeptidase